MTDEEREQHREKCRRWREANRERHRENCRRWREAHPEQHREAVRRWREANPEKLRERVRRWREANPERERERVRRWWREHRAKPASALRLAVREAFAAAGPESGGAAMARSRLCGALLACRRAPEGLLDAAAERGGLGADPAEVAGCLAAMCLFTGADRWPEWGRALVEGWLDACAAHPGPRWFVRRVRAAGRLAARLGAPQWAADAIGTPVREYYEGGADDEARTARPSAPSWRGGRDEGAR